MWNRLIIYCVLNKLGLSKYEPFRFNNQKTDAIYYFTSIGLKKYQNKYSLWSNVSLNWLLSDECEITSLAGDDEAINLVHKYL